MKTTHCRDTQSGAALVVSLVLLVVVTVLAISGMNTATTDLAMARNDQSYENAFQAAESGLELALSQGRYNMQSFTTVAQDINEFDSVTAVINFDESTQVPDRAFSLGVGSGIAAFHFVVTATADSKPAGTGGAATDRDATATHTQAFYILGPGGPTL